jgi:tryptophan synthase beta subunit
MILRTLVIYKPRRLLVLQSHSSARGRDLPRDHIIVMNMCGRGDKGIFTVAKHL